MVGDFLLKFVTAGVIFALIDSVWLTLVANRFYKSQIGNLLLDRPNLIAAGLFYIIFIIALGVPLDWIAIVSPLVITFLLLFVSGIPFTEKRFRFVVEIAVKTG